jgi:hypothetical protein
MNRVRMRNAKTLSKRTLPQSIMADGVPFLKCAFNECSGDFASTDVKSVYRE